MRKVSLRKHLNHIIHDSWLRWQGEKWTGD
nr:MAG TPA: hypothetical protein [Caudoviricetes sp.]